MMHLMCSGNSTVFKGMLITALSVRKFTRDPVTLHVLTMDLTDMDPAFRPVAGDQSMLLETVYREASPESRVIVHDMGDAYRKELLGSPNGRTRFTPYCFLRLFADEIPGLPDKVLYLDTDVVLNGDVSELYGLDISEYELAGVPDYYGRWFFGGTYVNSGVILLNLGRIRETGLFRKAVLLCREKRVFLPDQTALNGCATAKMLLPRKYNEQHGMREDTLLRHFSVTFRFWPLIRIQSIKPWEIGKVHDVLHCFEFDDILRAYAEMGAQQTKRSHNDESATSGQSREEAGFAGKDQGLRAGRSVQQGRRGRSPGKGSQARGCRFFEQQAEEQAVHARGLSDCPRGAAVHPASLQRRVRGA